ncbi:MAG: hypothetical protein IIB81_03975 [Nanoarchaeota archaeon]|nr:hypothetical protein [Nanoarchaeota archaeon]
MSLDSLIRLKTTEEINSIIKKAVIMQARQDYQIMTSKRIYTIYADHVMSPECLAYALGKREFSESEIEKIPFDHGDTPETFQKKYGEENLISNLRKSLLNPS